MRLPPEQRVSLDQIAIANVHGLNNMSNAEDVDDGQSINSQDKFHGDSIQGLPSEVYKQLY